MRLFTIGFTKKSAENFFTLLRESGAKKIVDVRLNNASQLAGFAKQDDLRYFLSHLCKMDYLHIPELAPTKEMLDDYRKNHKDWNIYEKQFLALMEERKIEKTLKQKDLADGCLLCSEHEPHHCHRRLVAEHLTRHWGKVQVRHLS